jgi:hypothetical protein
MSKKSDAADAAAAAQEEAQMTDTTQLRFVNRHVSEDGGHDRIVKILQRMTSSGDWEDVPSVDE